MKINYDDKFQQSQKNIQKKTNLDVKEDYDLIIAYLEKLKKFDDLKEQGKHQNPYKGFHQLKYDTNKYVFCLGGKNSKYRLIVYKEDDTTIFIEQISNHYDKRIV